MSNILNTGKLIYYAKRITFYTDIDEMPIFNWNKFRDTEKGKYLIKSVKSSSQFVIFFKGLYYGFRFILKPITFNKNYYNDAWERLYQQYIDKFGFEENFQEILKLKKEQFDKIVNHMTTPIDKRKRFTITEVKIIDMQIAEIEKNMPKGIKQDFESVKVYVDKWLSSVLDDRKTSVVQYQYYLNEMRLESQKAK